MKIAVTGAGGLVGMGLVSHLESLGHLIYPLVRRKPEKPGREIYWNPAAGEIDAAGLEGMDGVIHLAGENLAGYWTRAKKERIVASRKEGTRLLSMALAGLRRPPRLLISASAVGFYGDGGEKELDETSLRGSGYLADVCAQWEAGADPARQAGIRVVHSRFGLILDPKGGALAKLLPLLRLGLGGRLGSGRQYWSWVAMKDVHRALAFILEQPGLAGPVNITAPMPVTNAEFTRTFARALHRQARFAVPAFALRLVMGEMAQEMLLNGSRVLPKKLLAAGFQFAQPDLETAVTCYIE